VARKAKCLIVCSFIVFLDSLINLTNKQKILAELFFSGKGEETILFKEGKL
jgi:hypothetical protein